MCLQSCCCLGGFCELVNSVVMGGQQTTCKQVGSNGSCLRLWTRYFFSPLLVPCSNESIPCSLQGLENRVADHGVGGRVFASVTTARWGLSSDRGARRMSQLWRCRGVGGTGSPQRSALAPLQCSTVAPLRHRGHHHWAPLYVARHQSPNGRRVHCPRLTCDTS